MKTYKRWISMLLTACMLTSFLTMTSCRKKTSAPDKHDTSIPETNMGNIVYYQTSSENVVTDNETGIMFVNNELLVYGTSDSLEFDVARTIESYGGKIVGKIPVVKEYQVQLPGTSSYSELEAMAQKLEQEDCIEKVFTNLAMSVSEDAYYPNDSKWQWSWSDMPRGKNWGVEAIDAPGAWEYRDKMQTVNIGLIDTMFYSAHDDLTFAEEPMANKTALDKYKGEFNSHGTHVAGTMAAEFDNKKGISGIAVKKNLYGVANWGCYENLESNTLQQDIDLDTQVWCISLAYLIAIKHCRVINISMANDNVGFAASRGNQNAQKFFAGFNGNLSYFLKKLIDAQYDFLICKASGNSNYAGKDVAEGYKYFRGDENDEKCVWGYYNKSDYNKWANGEESDYTYENYRQRMDQNQIGFEWGNVDAKYDIFSGITDQKVADHIIVVGSVQNNGVKNVGGLFGIGSHEEHQGFSVANSSQCGNRVDVVAPGVDIYSTVSNDTASQSLYKGGWGGTSMASPHVAGVAALVYSVNPKLNGKQVRWIIRDTATGSYDGYCNGQKYSYGLVNAKAAVEKAMEWEPDGSFDPFIYEDDIISSDNTESDITSSDDPISSDQTVSSDKPESDIASSDDGVSSDEAIKAVVSDPADISSDPYDDHEITYISKRKIYRISSYFGGWTTYYEYDTSGRLAKQRYHNGIRSVDEAWWIYEYDPHTGLCICERKYMHDGEKGKTEYSYDSRGRLIREYALTYVSADVGYLEDSNTEYTYSSDDQILTKRFYWYNSEKTIYITQYEYDDKGFCTKESYYQQSQRANGFDGLTGWTEYEYNEDHTSAVSYSFSSNGTRSKDYRLYSYDAEGNCLTREYYNEQGELDPMLSDKYTYITVNEAVRY